MSLRTGRILAVTLLLAVVAGWAWIVSVAADPETSWGSSWFELALRHFAVTFFAALAAYILWQPAHWRPRAARAALAVGAVLVAAAAIELPAAAGLVDYRRILVPHCLGGTGPHNRQLDPELVYRHLPHDHFVHQQPGDSTAGLAIPGARRYRAEVECDANGFRNAKDYSQADVVLLGDSFVEGYDVTQEAICSTRLAERLSTSVCNLALCGFGPQQELAALKRYGLPLRPRAVVWFFYEGNDLSDIEDYEQVMGRWKEYVAEQNGYAARSFFLNILDSDGPLCYWLDQRRWRPSELARRRAGRLRPEVPGSGGRTIWFGGPPLELDDHMLALVGKLQSILLEAKQSCDANQAKLLVVFEPRKERVYQDLCTFDADSKVPGYRWNDLPGRLGAWCGEQKIEYLDLTPPLQAAARSGKLVYLVDDPHWSADGHDVVAAEVARRLTELHWIDARSAVP